MTGETLALLGGSRAQTVEPARYPEFAGDTLARVTEFLQRGPVQGLSKRHAVIERYESAMAAFHDVPHCLGASSGHGALQSALVGLEITGGDHVLTSPYSWGASVSCILHNDAVPIFADVNPETGLLDAQKLGDYVTPQTTAILVPHIYGQVADMTEIMEFASARGLQVIEDGSQAHGAQHRGRRVGGFGDASGFSVNGVKPLATTEGGYMLSKRADVYWKATLSCQHAGRSEMLGRSHEAGFPEELRPYIDSLVYTYRPDCVSALLATDGLGQLEEQNRVRTRQAERLLAGIAEIPFLSSPHPASGDLPVYYMLTLNFDRVSAGIRRDTFLDALRAEGVAAVAYVEKPLSVSPRLSPNWTGPRVMWTDRLRRSGIDPNAAELPGCEAKVARSIELPWSGFATDQPELLDGILAAFEKVSGQLDVLRAYEGSGPTLSLAQADG